MAAAVSFPQHLLAIEEISALEIQAFLALAENYTLPSFVQNQRSLLKGLTVINLFFEESTRTRTSFELAAKRLGADIINIATATSSLKKGESIRDMVLTLQAMKLDVLIVRHPESGSVDFISKQISSAAVINAGDGTHEHPTQAFLDALTIKRHKKNIGGLKIAICGDVLHSRVARSNIHLLGKLGAQIHLVGPRTLIPQYFSQSNIQIHYNLREGFKNADVIIMLRLQQERMQGAFVPSLEEYMDFFGLTMEKLKHAKPDVLVMEAGPINRGVEISGQVADSLSYSAILEQVEMGVAVRMACLDALTQKKRLPT